MSQRNYPAFCTLNQPELELPLSLPVPVDQAINTHPSLDEVAWHNNPTTTLLLQQLITAAAPYNNLASFPAGNFQETHSLQESSPPTRELTGPVRLKHAHHRVVHACDYCRRRKTKVTN